MERCNGLDDDCNGIVDDEPGADADCRATVGPNQVCRGGQCACATVCGGLCVDLKTDASNCGQCGAACPAVAHGAPVCAAGVCSYQCQPGWSDCDRNAANGCEANLQSDASNCGACGTSCNGQACVTGVCQSPCRAGHYSGTWSGSENNQYAASGTIDFDVSLGQGGLLPVTNANIVGVTDGNNFTGQFTGTLDCNLKQLVMTMGSATEDFFFFKTSGPLRVAANYDVASSSFVGGTLSWNDGANDSIAATWTAK
jgi:hypothetical protein